MSFKQAPYNPSLIYTAGLIAASEGYADVTVVAALKKRRVRRALVREYRAWRAERLRDGVETISLDEELTQRCEDCQCHLMRMDIFVFDGSFLEGFLTFLIENQDEIFELIKTIIGFIALLGTLRDDEHDSFDDPTLFCLAAGLDPDEIDIESTSYDLED